MARGVNTVVDSANVYVEAFDFLTPTGSVGSVLTLAQVTASVTGSFVGADFVNTVHKGGKFFINFTTITATCTVRFSIQSKDPLSGLYVVVATLSLDGLTTGNINIINAMHLYPGIGAGGSTFETNFSEAFTRTMRVIASITATATGGGAAISGTIGLSKQV